MIQGGGACLSLRQRARTIHHLSAATAYRRHVRNTQTSRQRISTAIRLPVDLHAQLQRQAEEREVSVNYLVTRAVVHYLRQLRPPDPLAGTCQTNTGEEM